MSISSGWSGRTHEMVWFGGKKLAIFIVVGPLHTTCSVPSNQIIKEPAPKHS